MSRGERPGACRRKKAEKDRPSCVSERPASGFVPCPFQSFWKTKQGRATVTRSAMTDKKGESGKKPEEDESEPKDADALLRQALRQCNVNAGKHERAAQLFLRAGLGVSIGAILLYIFFLTRITYVETEFVPPGSHKEHSLLPGTPPDPKIKGPVPSGAGLGSNREEEDHSKRRARHTCSGRARPAHRASAPRQGARQGAGQRDQRHDR